MTWLLLIGAAVVAPPVRPDSGEWVMRLLSGDVVGENPAMLSLFNLMGLWPWLMAALLVEELLPAAEPRSWRDRVPALPFVVLANVGGMFVLGLYFVLRAPDRRPARPRRWLAWLGTRTTAAVLGVVGAGLVFGGVMAGDIPALVETVRTEGFAWTMTFDFLAFWAVATWWCVRALGPATTAWVPVVGTAAAAWQVATERSA